MLFSDSRFGQFLVSTIPDSHFNERSLVVDNPVTNGGCYIIVESKLLVASLDIFLSIKKKQKKKLLKQLTHF